MKYQEFMEHVRSYIAEQLDTSYKVMIQPVLKNNGMVYDGLIIADPIINISPTIYLNPFYHRYLSGISLSDICQDILTIYRENTPTKDFDISLFKDFSKAKKHIIVKLVNLDRNRELLERVPYVPFHDLALIFLCAITDYLEDFATILIQNEHLALWNISLNELYLIAMNNTPSLLPFRLDKMEEFIEKTFELPFSNMEQLHMTILTNYIKVNGAACIVYPNLLKHIADILNDNLVIIPSSIHEVLIVPEKTAYLEHTKEELNEIIIEVNETQLKDDEVLSDHAYIYMKDTGEITY